MPWAFISSHPMSSYTLVYSSYLCIYFCICYMNDFMCLYWVQMNCVPWRVFFYYRKSLQESCNFECFLFRAIQPIIQYMKTYWLSDPINIVLISDSAPRHVTCGSILEVNGDWFNSTTHEQNTIVFYLNSCILFISKLFFISILLN